MLSLTPSGRAFAERNFVVDTPGARIVASIHENGPSSVSEICNNTGLSHNNTSKILTQLIKAGYVTQG